MAALGDLLDRLGFVAAFADLKVFACTIQAPMRSTSSSIAS